MRTGAGCVAWAKKSEALSLTWQDDDKWLVEHEALSKRG